MQIPAPGTGGILAIFPEKTSNFFRHPHPAGIP